MWAHHVPLYQSRLDQWPSWNFFWHLIQIACSLTHTIFKQLVLCEEHKRYEGTTRTRAEPKKGIDIWSEISVVFRGSCSHFLQHNPLQCSTRQTCRQEQNVKEAQCQLMPLFFVNRLFYRASDRGGITHQVINAMGRERRWRVRSLAA